MITTVVKISMTIEELQEILDNQKKVTAEYMTRNLSVYHWWDLKGVDSDRARKELTDEAKKSGYPNDFNVLKKYVK